MGERTLLSTTADAKERLPNTDLTDPSRRIWIFTTACLPWLTGTAVNPLLRAAHLQRGRAKGLVTLVVPWLDAGDQDKVFPKGVCFERQEEQEAHVRAWLARADLAAESESIAVAFYPGRYHGEFGSIFPMGDLTAMVPDADADVCVLEEPEHLNWFKGEGAPWCDKFNYVIGIIHTNYMFYAWQQPGGLLKSEAVRWHSSWMVRAYCHRILKLSAALQTFAPAKEIIVNTHGVRKTFLDIGMEAERSDFFEGGRGAYFIGKMLWSKGADRLLPLLRAARRRRGHNYCMDIYGSGPDAAAVREKAGEYKLDLTFHEGVDHATLGDYRVLVNPSTSEVLCTTVAEALAMGKFVIIARHPSNEFFFQEHN
ncbi:unnamed protein product, partial [Phaeothamnion confervicola]